MITLQTDARFDDLERLVARLARPGNRQQRMILDAIRRQFQENFTRQGSGQGAWAPLKPATVAQRRRLGFAGNRPILVRHGSYRSSFVDPASPDHYDNVSMTGIGIMFEAGSDDPRGEPLEKGTALMAARPVTLLDEAQEAEIFGVIELVIDQLNAEFK